MPNQEAFSFDSDFPRRKTRSYVADSSHDGPCQLEFDPLGTNEIVPHTLRCKITRSHRFRLDPSARKQAMLALLNRNELMGKARDEALTWKAGRVPWGFVIA